ncbi:TIGR01906 family membrane protein [Levilactobacillus suantsaii]|uniref:TIGR01906 family membrane protein n=1 Tax=Levilactobacillus suantsaii TaxID=2292255 RepID=A0A4Q0VJJ0_9LACO|nr:TIGR01906 family membrane protein [Levilactobacillus suantsaii]QMU07863.1 TIGR01906 family membrane protein [Levilactobacillus suantsaii]RXI79742.1 TIGR01906 family membrane protein [Levilactobacillus suantsaii]
MTERLKRWGGLTAVILLLLSLSITLTINGVWLYRLDINWLHIEHTVNLSAHTLMHNYGQLLAYLELPWVTDLNMSNFPTSFTGMIHFEDVKRLFLINHVVLLLSLWPAGWYLRQLSKRATQWRLLRPMQIVAVVPVALAVCLVVNFNGFFVTFHEILFRNNDWLFDPDLDPVILALPDTFFLHCFILAFGLFELGVLGLYWWAKRAVKRAI